MSRRRGGDEIPGGPPGQKSPSAEALAFERMKYTMDQLPDQGVTIQPPANLGPKVIEIPRQPEATGPGRYVLATYADVVSIIDTQQGITCAQSIEECRGALEELIRLANRVET